MTHRDQFRFARWLYRHGSVPTDKVPPKFNFKNGTRSKYFTIICTEYDDAGYAAADHPLTVKMTDENIDNYRAEVKRVIIERRDWIEPFVSVIALIVSIVALFFSIWG